MPADGPFRFAGFASPNYTQIPDDFFDVLMPHLSEAELRVLLYVMRRTFGFKKRADAISISQMVNGITTKDGVQLDAGCGLKRTAVKRGVAGLVEKGVLSVTKQQAENGEYETNIYALVMRDEGVGHERTHPWSPSDLPVGRQVTIQETVEQQTERQETERFEDSKGKPDITLWEDAEATVLDYLTDYAREFHDQAPLVSSHRRAMNLYRISGLDLETFLAAMQTARAKTKLYSASIRAEPVGEGLWKQKPRMAYWFSILEELVGSPRRRVAGE